MLNICKCLTLELIGTYKDCKKSIISLSILKHVEDLCVPMTSPWLHS